MRRMISALGVAAGLTALQGCIFNQDWERSPGLGGWLPPSSQCVRNNAVPFSSPAQSIGAELTRLFADPACVTQPICTGRVERENYLLPDGNSASEMWNGFSNHFFSIQEQNNIGTTAYNYAMGRRPPGKDLYRLTFDQGIAVGSGPSAGRVFARAYYGRCVKENP